MTTREMLESLSSTTCPFCTGAKRPRQTFCGRCYFALPGDMRQALYRLVGRGYETAFEAAMGWLETKRLERSAKR